MFDLQLIRPRASTRDRVAFAVAGGLWRASVVLQRAAAKVTSHADGAREEQRGRRLQPPANERLTDQLKLLSHAQRRELRVVDRQVRR